ncbi:MAG: hypothetical protein JWP85_2138 [Rhodoglobus sp.]|nr:hypothetical protein [Rhodoglobus sp.]
MISTYILNGVDLDDNAYGWSIQSSSEPHPGIKKRSLGQRGGQRDGNTPLPASEDSPIVRLTVRVPDSGVQMFEAFIDAEVLILGHDSQEAVVELIDASPAHGFDFTEFSCLFRFNEMFWRDPAVATSVAAALAADSVVVSVMAGLTAPVRDAIVRVKGGFTDLKVIDSRGSFFHAGLALPNTSWLRFESDTGRAFTTATDVWAGGTEVTGSIDNGAGAYYLQLSPYFTDLAVRTARLTVETAGRSGSPTIEVRGKRAHRV